MKRRKEVGRGLPEQEERNEGASGASCEMIFLEKIQSLCHGIGRVWAARVETLLSSRYKEMVCEPL